MDFERLASQLGTVIVRRERESARAQLARLTHLDMDAPEVQAFYRDMEAAREEEEQVRGFRWHVLKTQHFQDRVLGEYRNWVSLVYHSELEEFTGDQDTYTQMLDTFGFPPTTNADNKDWEALATNLRLFMLYQMPRSTPASLDAESISYNHMLRYRFALQFWARRVYVVDRKQQPPPHWMLHNTLTEALRYLSVKLNIKYGRQSLSPKSHLGFFEIMQLIDMDLRGTPSVALAESHHLAWLLARCCTIRPSSIGTPTAKFIDPEQPIPYLCFGDFEVTRSIVTPGQFDIDLTIRNTKQDQAKAAGSTGQHRKTVRYRIKSAQQPENIMFSVPHRFLVLALRRGALRDYTTIEELFQDNRHKIAIHESFKTKPVVVAGTHRGLHARFDVPATAEALSAYLKLRGQRMGYRLDVTFYSIRRRAGTDFARVLGHDLARQIMCHDAKSRVMEASYLDSLVTADVSAVGLEEDPGARRDEMVAESSNLALTRLKPEELARTHGKEFNAVFQTALLQDPVFEQCKTDSERKNRRRVLKRRVMRYVTRALHENSQLTVEEVRQRLQDFVEKATEFNKALIQKILDDDNTDDEGPFLEEDDGGLFVEQDDEEDEPEADLDEDVPDNALIEILEEEPASDVFSNYASFLNEREYQQAAKMMMHLLMEIDYNTKLSSGVRAQCPLCLDDDSMTDEADNKLRYYEQSKLERHILSAIHSPFQRLYREWRNERQQRPDQSIICEFCRNIIPQDQTLKIYSQVQHLTRHIERSTETKIQGMHWSTEALAQQHHELKVAVGWYDADFKGDEATREHQARRTAESRTRRRKETRRYTFTDDKELYVAIQVPGSEAIVQGSFTDLGQARRFEAILEPRPFPVLPDSGAYIRARHQGIVAFGNASDSVTRPLKVSAAYTALIEKVIMPGQDSSDEKDLLSYKIRNRETS